MISPELDENDFRKRMIEKIKANFAHLLEPEDLRQLENATDHDLELLARKVFRRYSEFN